MRPRTVAAVLAGKAAGSASRLLRLGGGTAIAGLVAEWLDPRVVQTLASDIPNGSVIISATNGKTTTAAMLAAAAREAGLRPLANASGSNMMRGIAAALVLETGVSGSLRDAGDRLGIFEVDEAVLPYAVEALRPRAVVLGNLFRDQLDRYGEVDHVAGVWRRTLESAPERMAVALNADDPSVASLGRYARGPLMYFGVEDASVAREEREHAADVRWCPACGGKLSYSAVYYGHVGKWWCEGTLGKGAACDNARPAPGVRAEQVLLRPDGSDVRMATPQGDLQIELRLAGLYNVYNALAAAGASLAIGLPLDAFQRAMTRFTAAFGRQERFDIEGRAVQVLLGKNPVGMNQALRAITAAPGPKRLLLFLNDGEADGRDVSWIWDVDFESLREAEIEALFAAGRRAEDMALRLKYAGLGADVPAMRKTAEALDEALRATPPGGTLYVVPTYTAMLEARELLASHAGRRPYWEAAP